MQRKQVDLSEFKDCAFSLWSNNGILLTSGDFETGKFNSMTVGWGSIGIVWSMPFAQIFVRPSRYTLEFLEEYPTFTLCAFSDEYKEKLDYLGSVSGRDVDKIAESRLTPTRSQFVAAPCYQEAVLCIECEKMYWQDLDPANFLHSKIQERYLNKDYHRIYYGLVKGIFKA